MGNIIQQGMTVSGTNRDQRAPVGCRKNSKGVSGHLANPFVSLVRPARFELAAFGFVVPKSHFLPGVTGSHRLIFLDIF